MKIAILGARGIGKVHARIFQSLGSKVHAILGTDIKSTIETSNELMRSYGFKPKPFTCIQALLSEPIDAVSICTPPRLHVEHALAVFEKGIPVFCEKPLFWDDAMTKERMMVLLNQLKSHPNRRFIMNTPNDYFGKIIQDKINNPKEIHSIKFIFYTNGKCKGAEIGVDLFTHGLSLIHKILGLHNLSLFKYRSDEHEYTCSFVYGTCRIEFDFKENPLGHKLLLIDIDGRIFKRIQEGFGTTYHVYLHDSQTNEKIKVTDPFQQSVNSFLNYCKSGSLLGHDNFDDAEFIMKNMIQHLTASK